MKVNQAMQQFFQDPANKPAYDTIVRISQSQDVTAFNDYILQLKPRVEKATGMSLEKYVAPDVLKAYTTVGGTPALDGEYTVFGKIIQGLDVVDIIAAVEKYPNNRPLQDIRMTVTVEEMPKKKIEKLYGYQYP
jgi:peptidyl-prolyl cis-trans isomerase B (cyclophilin B)